MISKNTNCNKVLLCLNGCGPFTTTSKIEQCDTPSIWLNRKNGKWGCLVGFSITIENSRSVCPPVTR